MIECRHKTDKIRYEGEDMLRVKRTKTFVDMMRDYKVFIDGEYVGTVSNGETEAFDLSDGHHLVHFEIDWCRSKKMSLDVKNGESVVLHVKNSMRWFSFPFLYILYLSLFKTNYINVKTETAMLQNIENKFSPKKETDLRQLQTITF